MRFAVLSLMLMAACDAGAKKPKVTFEATLLDAWPDPRRAPSRKADVEIVFDEMVITSRPPRRRQKTKSAAGRPERRLPPTASR